MNVEIVSISQIKKIVEETTRKELSAVYKELDKLRERLCDLEAIQVKDWSEQLRLNKLKGGMKNG